MSDLVDLGVFWVSKWSFLPPRWFSCTARLRTAVSDRMQANRPVLHGGDSGNLPRKVDEQIR